MGFGAQVAWLHGWDRVAHFAEKAAQFPDPLKIGAKNSLWLTVSGEFIGPMLLLLGLCGRLGALASTATFGVALFVGGAGVPWYKRELAILYFAVALSLFLLGPGRFSVDSWLWPKLFRRGGSSRGSARAGSPAQAAG